MVRGALSGLIVLTLASCLESTVVRCADGTICPVDQTCDGHGGCLSAAEAEACRDHAEGEDCTLGGAAGACVDGECVLFFCGDGARDGAEPCEGADLGGATCLDFGFGLPDGLACNPDCTIDDHLCQGYCGDGARDGIELCDGDDLDGKDCADFGFYDTAGLACNVACNFDSSACTGYCGDGIANGPEVCDGAPPPEVCVDLGWDMGGPRCANGCQASTRSCGLVGWRTAVLPGGFAYGVWGFGKRDVVAVNSSGIVRWQGGSWNLMPGSPGGQLGLGGLPDDFYAVDDHRLFRFDGTSWSTVATWAPSGVVGRAVWRAGPNDVWIGDSKLRHWDGTTLTSQSLPLYAEIKSIWGFAPDDIWITGSDVLRHWDGTSWTSYGGYHDQVWGLAPDDVWLAGGGLSHWDGATWTPVNDLPVGGSAVIWGFAPDDLTVLDGFKRYHWDGQGWHPGSDLSFPATYVWGAGGELFVTGDGLHVAGAAEWAFPSGPAAIETLDDLWMNDDEDGWAVGYRGPQHWDGTAWSSVTLPDGRLPRFVWASGRDDVWMAGQNVVEHWNGGAWSTVLGPDSTFYAGGIWGTGTGDIFVGDADGIRHWNGTAWSTIPEPAATPAQYRDVFGTSASDVWAIDTFSVVSHYDGTSNTIRATPAGAWNAGWAAAPDDVWLVGDAGRTIHWDGASWTEAPPHASEALGHVWGLASDDIYATGSHTLLHYDGQGWSPAVVPGAIENLVAVHGGPHRIAITGAVPVSHDARVFFFEHHGRWWE